MSFLRDYQIDAVNRLSNGKILMGNVGSGKSRTGLYYYFKENGGKYIDNYIPMKNPQDLYIITTAKKRDSLEWNYELAPYLLSIDEEANYYDNTVIVDSWNNIKKYVNIQDSFFIFDEDRITGTGAWAKTFIKITRNNNWILLTATPGDNFMDYCSIFIANGFFKNMTQFKNEHVIFDYSAKFPRIDRYVGTAKLNRLRNNLLVKMDYSHEIEISHIDILCNYSKDIYKYVMKNRWDIYKDEPIETASGLCYILRKVSNSDPSRAKEVIKIRNEKRKVIIFYSFDYELEILKKINYGDNVIVKELNGHQHDEVPDGDDWVYLVNYSAGAEAWQCIKTDTIIFYSQNYSYKIMVQAAGRIDRLNTPFKHLYYYHLKSTSNIDLAISKALKEKKKFNESAFIKG